MPRSLTVLQWVLMGSLALSGTSCRTASIAQMVPNPETRRDLSAADKKRPKQIELYFDGTANDWTARTNVRRRFEMVACLEDPKFPCCYIEGVGVRTITGKIFGVGLKQRVLCGYEFLARNWRPGDKVLIFGFSRGAFEARILAGLMAHCGVPDATMPNGEVLPKARLASLRDTIDQVWDYCAKELKDPIEKEPSTAKWEKKLKENCKQTADHFAASGFVFRSQPQIDLLALWDTVPGLAFTKLQDYGVATADHPQVYKLRPYPNIKLIAHALALNERRSKFNPLLVGPPIDADKTTVYEVWFPGAHADVGGGYSDSNDMASISFNWIHKIMLDAQLAHRPTAAYTDACSVMHHPERKFPNNLGSKDLSRTVPEGSMIDRSVFVRANGDSHLEDNGRYVSYAPAIQVQKAAGGLETVKIASVKHRTKMEQKALLLPLLKYYDTEEAITEAKALRGKAQNSMDALTVQTITVKNEVPVDSAAKPMR